MSISDYILEVGSEDYDHELIELDALVVLHGEGIAEIAAGIWKDYAKAIKSRNNYR